MVFWNPCGSLRLPCLTCHSSSHLGRFSQHGVSVACLLLVTHQDCLAFVTVQIINWIPFVKKKDMMAIW